MENVTTLKFTNNNRYKITKFTCALHEFQLSPSVSINPFNEEYPYTPFEIVGYISFLIVRGVFYLAA